MSLTKISLGTTLLGCAATGTALMFTGSSPMTKWRPLSDDQLSESSDPYKGKYAENYKRYLVGVGTAATGKTPADNNPWWKWSYINRYGYSNGSEGFDKSKIIKWEDLKNTCEKAYKGTKEENSTEVKEGEVKYKEGEIWKYCSPAGTKIRTVKEVITENGNTTIYKEKIAGEYENHLISTHENNWFWNLKQKEFKEYNSWDTSSNDDVFQKTQRGLNTGTEEGYIDLRTACQVVYSKDKNEKEKYKKYLFQFCSLTGTEL